MSTVGPPFFVVAVLFGALMGFVLGRNAEDRAPTLASCGLCLAVGAVAWLLADSGTAPEVAGASMTVGGAVALATAAITGRRPA